MRSKRPVSVAVKRRLTESGNTLIRKLTVRQRPGVTTFRFWQEGPGYDRNLNQTKTIKSAIEYIHLNPVRRGLCQKAIDWKWSSARLLLESRPQSSPPNVHRVNLDAGLICSQEAGEHC
jgi:putative transposase